MDAIFARALAAGEIDEHEYWHKTTLTPLDNCDRCKPYLMRYEGPEVKKKQQTANVSLAEAGNYYAITITYKWEPATIGENDYKKIYSHVVSTAEKIFRNKPTVLAMFGVVENTHKGVPHVHLICKFEKGKYPKGRDLYATNGGHYVKLDKLYAQGDIERWVTYMEKGPIATFGDKSTFVTEGVS